MWISCCLGGCFWYKTLISSIFISYYTHSITSKLKMEGFFLAFFCPFYRHFLSFFWLFYRHFADIFPMLCQHFFDIFHTFCLHYSLTSYITIIQKANVPFNSPNTYFFRTFCVPFPYFLNINISNYSYFTIFYHVYRYLQEGFDVPV